jgi:large subunit ribosomal protein L27
MKFGPYLYFYLSRNMAHKKAAGAAKNLRDSQPKYRGIKLFGGQKAVA